MRVGNLIRHRQTGKVSFVTWVYSGCGTHFKAWGYPPNQVFTVVAWEVISEAV